MIWREHITLPPFSHGFHQVDHIIVEAISDLKEDGILFLHLLHTSAALTVNENCDPDVWHDMDLYFKHMVPENLSSLRHTFEGKDDMPAHVGSSLFKASLSLPIAKGNLILGDWQGIFLCEFRKPMRSRNIVLTFLS